MRGPDASASVPPGVRLPSPFRRRLRRLTRPGRLGLARRTAPVSRYWGWDRGTPVDRYYIERFLDQNRDAIRGRVLEVGDARYTTYYGHSVERSDVLDVSQENPHATIVADLARADAIPSATFDCFILVQTLQYIFDVDAAVRHTHRILRPGGVVLCTLPSISRVGRRCLDTEYWRFTAASARSLFRERFEDEAVAVESYGNVLTAIAFLTGMAAEELSRRELETTDPYFPVVITVRARRS